MERIVVALGGNALERSGGDGSWAQAVVQMREAARGLASAVREGAELILTHGNGPQVGVLLRQNELAEREVPPRPVDVLVAESQGQIGYLIGQELEAALARERSPRTVLNFPSRMVVDAKDPAFQSPSKPVGRFYSEAEANLLRKSRGWAMSRDAARGGWRRLLPSPRPLRWLEAEAFLDWMARRKPASTVPIVAGGGGIPVLDRGQGRCEGVEAVIDKDYAAALVARTVAAPRLAILTDVPGVAVGFHRTWERWLGSVSASELREFHSRGEFSVGSMGPKVEAALEFLNAGGREALICDTTSLPRALRGQAGTRVRPG
ncbi:MAG: carbamate kinase [Thermoplasmata archaeon]|nr:carbamate kinase [Thermoplasmata archaeon]MCI4341651.1 carbamate kinase [Thermoplasmata archaeon]